MKDRTYLANMYFATRTVGQTTNGEPVTTPSYESWLEQQLLTSIAEVERFEEDQRLRTATQIFNGALTHESQIFNKEEAIPIAFDLADKLIAHNKYYKQ